MSGHRIIAFVLLLFAALLFLLGGLGVTAKLGQTAVISFHDLGFCAASVAAAVLLL